MSFAKELLVKLLSKFVKGATADTLSLRHMLLVAGDLDNPRIPWQVPKGGDPLGAFPLGM